MLAPGLDDVVVLDCTTAFWSSLGTALLADFGAQVLRLDDARAAAPPAVPGGWDHEAELAQRNKRSVAVDLDDAGGTAVLHDLIRASDVVVLDWPHAEIARRRLDHDSLRALRPDVISAWGSGFGPRGPDRDLPALDELAAARTGMMPILPQPGQPPVYTGAGQMYAAVMLALGVALALHHRAATGEGQAVDVSLFAGNMYGASLDVQAFLAMGGERFLHPVARADAGNPMSGVLYQAEDGRWVCLTMPDTDRWWPGLAAIVGIDAADPRFDTHDKRCGANRLELIRVLEAAFRRQPAAHWRHELNARQLSADVIEAFDFPAADPQARRNRYIVELDRPGAGRVQSLGFPLFMSATPARWRRAAPGRGQHSAEVLHELLGYSEERIGALAAAGSIA